jgi:pantothenate kinase type III
MDAEKQNIKLDIQNWRIRIDERSRNRMKIQIKLSKDEAEAFKNFSNLVKPEEISDDDFMKTVFVTGCEALNQQLSQMVQQYAKENQAELESSGITVVEGEDGQVQLMESEKVETTEAVEEA